MSWLSLNNLSGIEDLARLKPGPEAYRDHWLVGFGWDEHRWASPVSVTRQILDHIFPNTPVYFIRADSHAAWLNTLALKELEFWHPAGQGPLAELEEFVPRAEDGWPRGLLLERAKFVTSTLLPKPTHNQCKALLQLAANTFNRAGFTHIRDMSCSPTQWQAALDLDRAEELTLAVIQNFHVYNFNEFDEVLRLALVAKKEQSRNIRVKGLKFFYDGSLGSETAYLSRCYHGRNHCGQIVYPQSEIREMIEKSWASGLDICVHTIGDQAADDIVNLIQELHQQGKRGSTNLEHVEILRPDTIQKMRGLQMTCHLQPCHWLTDRVWLKDKLGPLFSHIFPWASLEAQDIPIFFGSDSPIEPASLFNNALAVDELAQQGVPRPQRQVFDYQTCPEPNFGSNSYTILEETQVREVVFEGVRRSIG